MKLTFKASLCLFAVAPRVDKSLEQSRCQIRVKFRFL